MRVSSHVTALVTSSRSGFLRGANLDPTAVTRVLHRIEPEDHHSFHAVMRLLDENLEKIEGSSQASRLAPFLELLQALRNESNQRRLQALELAAESVS